MKKRRTRKEEWREQEAIAKAGRGGSEKGRVDKRKEGRKALFEERATHTHNVQIGQNRIVQSGRSKKPP